MSNLSGSPAVRSVSALIGSIKINRLLGLPVYLGQDQLADLLDRCGVPAAGTGARGCLVWPETEIVSRLEAIQSAHRAAAAGLGAEISEALRQVLTEKIGEAVRQVMERTVVPALDETDVRLDRLQESMQGLFRQQGENGQRVRDVATALATFTADVRKSGDAVRMNVGAVLAEVVDRNQVTSGQLREELEALRLSVNELCKVLK